MGNRGNLHTDAGVVVRPYKRKAWVACLLEYRNRARQVMAPGQYTELFFLDEATSLAAGHRPCGTCRRESLQRFTACWEGPADLKSIDAALHAQRLTRDHSTESLFQLPDGTFVTEASGPHTPLLWWKGVLWTWSFGGYIEPRPVTQDRRVRLLTPPLMVGLLRKGYPVTVHDSLSTGRGEAGREFIDTVKPVRKTAR